MCYLYRRTRLVSRLAHKNVVGLRKQNSSKSCFGCNIELLMLGAQRIWHHPYRGIAPAHYYNVSHRPTLYSKTALKRTLPTVPPRRCGLLQLIMKPRPHPLNYRLTPGAVIGPMVFVHSYPLTQMNDHLGHDFPPSVDNDLF